MKYPVELNSDECQLLLDYVVLSTSVEKTLKRMVKKEGIHKTNMSLDEIHEIAGWLAAEANHAKSRRVEQSLDELYTYFDTIEYQIKRSLHSKL
ncbi:MAG: hypothetical protein AABZ60_07880 [Planctomycetota bacterium]